MLLADIVVGIQHGDEGKGKVSNCLCKDNDYDLCVRFNGGPNAGHTIYVNETKIVLHQIPIGIIYGIRCLIGPTCVLDCRKLEEELTLLEKSGFENVRKMLYISYNVHTIEEKHIQSDINNNKVGTTCSGIGPTYTDKYARCGNRLKEVNEICGCRVIDPLGLLYSGEVKNIFMEGAQGFELDIDWGDYPYVTSSSCLSGASTLTGISPKCISKIYGVAKIYETYVGSKKFGNHDDNNLQRLQKLGNEYGATTGRVRKCNWLNLYRLRRAILVNGVTHLIINKCDVMELLGKFHLYNIKNELMSFGSLQEMKDYIRKSLRHLETLEDIAFSSSKYTI